MLTKYLKMREKNSSILSIGLDSDFEKIDGNVLDFNKKIVSKTYDLVCGYKINIAFYEKMGAKGLKILEETVNYIKKNTELPIILDVKRGDIENTAKAYAYYYFERLKVDSITVNPLMGMDTVLPYLKYPDSHVFILALTSNMGVYDFEIPHKLYLHIVKKANELNSIYKDRVGIVVGATNYEYISEIVENSKNSLLLIPGIGTQGGDIKRLFENLGNYRNIVINVSRAIIFDKNPRQKAMEFNDMINKYYL